MPTDLRAARLAEMLTVTWMLVEAGTAIAAAVAARSVVLAAFGFDSLIELFSAGVVLRHLLYRTEDEAADEMLTSAEKHASRRVGWALFALIGFIVVSSSAILVLGVHPEPSTLGLAVTVTAIPVMAVLWRWRLGLADRLRSASLRGDAASSAVCLYMAAVALGGLALNRLFGWWWADPVAALALTWWIRGEALEAISDSTACGT